VFHEKVLSRLTKLPGARALWYRFPAGSVDLRVRYGIFSHPHYAYGVHAAAESAKRLGLPAITVIEFGVAGGRGLTAMANIAAEVGKAAGIQIRVTGFDSGKGMPEASDYRDLPHVWEKGFFEMDEALLRSVLPPGTELVLGQVGDTVPQWMSKKPAPIGFVAFDLDYYSSTKNAFGIFEDPDPALRLPRVHCYFDDTIWPEHACHNEFTGELLAIREFNEQHESRKICPIHLLRHTQIHPASWNDQMYAHHDFAHPLYCRNVTSEGDRHRQLRL